MKKNRMLKLADMLEADAHNRKGMKFDLNVIGRRDVTFETADDLVASDFKLDCGTIGCGMGLAAMSGEFKRAGLGFEVGSLGHIEITVDGERANYEDAAVHVFGISMDEATFLFAPEGWENDGVPEGAKGERRLANRIRALVAGEVKAPSCES